MRLYLLPISTRRTLIYCEKVKPTAADQKSWLDKGTTKAAALWASWEKQESGWQKKVVDYGNGALKRIPYEEWGLKSIPPLSARRKEEELAGKDEVHVEFPPTLIPEATVRDVIKTLATERQSLHKSRLIWSLVGTAVTAPIGVVPIIPNLPCYFLIFRAWSHWRALNGSKHLQFLHDRDLIRPQSSAILDELYSTGALPFNTPLDPSRQEAQTGAESPDERMILHKSNGRRIAEALKIPELNIELDRAVWQVEKALEAKRQLGEEKRKLDEASGESRDKKQS